VCSSDLVAPPTIATEPAPAPKEDKEKHPKAQEPENWSDKIMKDFWTLNFWLLILFAMLWGGIGGFVYELLILQGNIEIRHKLTKDEIAERFLYAIPTYLYDLGYFSRIIIGAGAAVAVLWVVQPSSLIGLAAVSLIAGSAGSSVFRSMQDRLNAALAVQKLAETQKKVDETKDQVQKKVTKLASSLEGLKDELVAKSISPTGSKNLVFEPTQEVDPSELEAAEKLLSELKTIGETL